MDACDHSLCERSLYLHMVHQELWHWLSLNPVKDKTDWPGWKWNGGRHALCRNLCPACEFAQHEDVEECTHCPIQWPINGPVYEEPCMESLYVSWSYARKNTEFAKASRIAAEIRDLPWKARVPN